MDDNRIVSFRGQRVGWTFVIFTIVFIFTSAILWNHVEGFMAPGTYQTMAKIGLLLLPLVTLMMTIYELFADDTGVKRKHASHPRVIRFVNWCFWGSIGLAICELIHAGAVLKYESSIKEQQAGLILLGDAQAKIAGAATSAAIESSGKVAKELNAAGQRRTAGKSIQSGKEIASNVTASAQKTVQEASAIKGDTFLPDWYIHGGMYAALSVLALACFGLTMFFARSAQPYIDKNDDGKPDYGESKDDRPRQYLTPPVPAPAPATAKNSNFTYPSDPKSAPRP